MKKGFKKKSQSTEDFSRTRLPKEGEFLAIVEKRLGGSRMRVKDVDGNIILGKIKSSVKKNIWVREGNLVLAVPWEFDKSKAFVIYKYSPVEMNYLRKKGYEVDFEMDEEF